MRTIGINSTRVTYSKEQLDLVASLMRSNPSRPISATVEIICDMPDKFAGWNTFFAVEIVEAIYLHGLGKPTHYDRMLDEWRVMVETPS